MYNKIKIFIVIINIINLVYGFKIFKNIKIDNIDIKKNNALVTNYKPCVDKVKFLIEKNANAIDIAIFLMLCDGIGKPQDSGLGGGFMSIIKIKNQIFTINSRERAPLNVDKYYENNVSNIILGRTIGVPSALKGYVYLHNNYGKIHWHEILNPLIDLIKDGFPVYIDDILKKKQYEYIEEKYRYIFYNKKTNELLKNDDIWYRNDLLETFIKIKNLKDKAFYHNDGYKNLIKTEINKNNGIIVDEDFNFEPLINNSYEFYIKHKHEYYKINTMSNPGSGELIAFCLKVMEVFYNRFKSLHKKNSDLYILIESLKFSYSFKTYLGDARFNDLKKYYNFLDRGFIVKILLKILTNKKTSSNISYYMGNEYTNINDEGTSNIVVKVNDTIISSTSTINLRFGSWVISELGIVYNNQLYDFNIKNRDVFSEISKNNYPEPKKFPMSSISPTIISLYNNKLKKFELKYSIGAAGGFKIISSITQVIYNLIFKKMNLEKSISEPRFHTHFILPNCIYVEREFNNKYGNFLKKYNYVIEKPFLSGDYNSVTGIQINNDKIIPVFDKRRSGDIYVW